MRLCGRNNPAGAGGLLVAVVVLVLCFVGGVCRGWLCSCSRWRCCWCVWRVFVPLVGVVGVVGACVVSSCCGVVVAVVGGVPACSGGLWLGLWSWSWLSSFVCAVGGVGCSLWRWCCVVCGVWRFRWLSVGAVVVAVAGCSSSGCVVGLCSAWVCGGVVVLVGGSSVGVVCWVGWARRWWLVSFASLGVLGCWSSGVVRVLAPLLFFCGRRINQFSESKSIATEINSHLNGGKFGGWDKKIPPNHDGKITAN